MGPIPYASAPVRAQLPFKDKRPVLIGVGVVCFVVAACTGCFTLLSPLALLMPQAGARQIQARDLVPAVGVYLVLTVIGTVLGLGAVRARRWVRPVLLPIAWGWALSMLVTGVIWLLAGPGIQAMMQASAGSGSNAPPPMPVGFQ